MRGGHLLCFAVAHYQKLPPGSDDAEPASHHGSGKHQVLISQLPLQLGCKRVTQALQRDMPAADAVELEACERKQGPLRTPSRDTSLGAVTSIARQRGWRVCGQCGGCVQQPRPSQRSLLYGSS